MPRPFMISLSVFAALFATAPATEAQDASPRELGVPFSGEPGPLNAITDVPGMSVGHTTRIEGDHIRTGITTIFPLGREDLRPVRAGFSRTNGTGEVTGSHLIEETGLLLGPVMLTDTWGVGTARNGYLRWITENVPAEQRFVFSLPVIAETSDYGLNDQHGMHLTEADVAAALDAARAGPVAQGNVGGGTGMVADGYKGGIGTASRRFIVDGTDFTVGVLVQANHDWQGNLQIAGIPVGRLLLEEQGSEAATHAEDKNSLIMVVATDMPLMPHQLERLARRAALGSARTGNVAMSVSGEFALAFATANPVEEGGPVAVATFEDTHFMAMNSAFQATVEATEEALINQLFASETLSGNGITITELPVDDVLRLLDAHNRLEPR